jgi:site-specific DNA-methyltransferase (adenine-specific)
LILRFASKQRMKQRPGVVRDAILSVLSTRPQGATVQEITAGVAEVAGAVPPSSIRSYLQLNTPGLFARMNRAEYVLQEFVTRALQFSKPPTSVRSPFTHGHATLWHADCFQWLAEQHANTIHAVVTDPPYGLVEYSDTEQRKLRAGRGGIWRIPPSFDGAKRSPLPRFTVLSRDDIEVLRQFFLQWARLLFPVLVPGGNVIVASNPLLSHVVSDSLARAGLERRGEIVRLVMTMRGGDRPKHAHKEFAGVSVMPRSMWEPWLVFRRPLEGRVQDNLRKWGTGGFRRLSADRPFGDVIESAPTRGSERRVGAHPSLKPQAFLRKLVKGSLPLGTGIVLDPFAGAGSTLAAAEAVGYASIGLEKDKYYFEIGCDALPRLAALPVPEDSTR